jgi:hypothetical protein
MALAGFKPERRKPARAKLVPPSMDKGKNGSIWRI